MQNSPGKFDEETVARFLRVYAPLVRKMWPMELNGLSQLPSHDRFLVVANHSGGGVAELWSLLLAWISAGPPRSVAAMAHPFGFRVPFIRDFLVGLGTVEATAQGAAQARAAGAPLLAFPGGDHEACRPFWQARRVDFAGRKGWIRLAREYELDIVPLAITGSHLTNPILLRGRWIAYATGLRLLGVHRAPLTVLSVASAFAAFQALKSPFGRPAAMAGAMGALWLTTMVPWLPAKIGAEFLAALPYDEWSKWDDQTVYDHTVGRLQSVLT